MCVPLPVPLPFFSLLNTTQHLHAAEQAVRAARLRLFTSQAAALSSSSSPSFSSSSSPSSSPVLASLDASDHAVPLRVDCDMFIDAWNPAVAALSAVFDLLTSSSSSSSSSSQLDEGAAAEHAITVAHLAVRRRQRQLQMQMDGNSSTDELTDEEELSGSEDGHSSDSGASAAGGSEREEDDLLSTARMTRDRMLPISRSTPSSSKPYRSPTIVDPLLPSSADVADPLAHCYLSSRDVLRLLRDGFRFVVGAAAAVRRSEVVDTVVSTLLSLTGLLHDVTTDLPWMSPSSTSSFTLSNQRAAFVERRNDTVLRFGGSRKCLFATQIAFYDVIRLHVDAVRVRAWHDIVDAVLQLQFLELLPLPMLELDDFVGFAAGHTGRACRLWFVPQSASQAYADAAASGQASSSASSSAGRLTSLFNYFLPSSSSYADTYTLDHESQSKTPEIESGERRARLCVAGCDVAGLFAESKMMNVDSLQALLQALVDAVPLQAVAVLNWSPAASTPASQQPLPSPSASASPAPVARMQRRTGTADSESDLDDFVRVSKDGSLSNSSSSPSISSESNPNSDDDLGSDTLDDDEAAVLLAAEPESSLSSSSSPSSSLSTLFDDAMHVWFIDVPLPIRRSLLLVQMVTRVVIHNKDRAAPLWPVVRDLLLAILCTPYVSPEAAGETYSRKTCRNTRTYAHYCRCCCCCCCFLLKLVQRLRKQPMQHNTRRTYLSTPVIHVLPLPLPLLRLRSSSNFPCCIHCNFQFLRLPLSSSHPFRHSSSNNNSLSLPPSLLSSPTSPYPLSSPPIRLLSLLLSPSFSSKARLSLSSPFPCVFCTAPSCATTSSTRCATCCSSTCAIVRCRRSSRTVCCSSSVCISAASRSPPRRRPRPRRRRRLLLLQRRCNRGRCFFCSSPDAVSTGTRSNLAFSV